MLKEQFIARIKQVRRVLWITMALNVIVAGLKLAYGHWTESLSMLADGFHSLLDSSSNVVGLVAISLAAKPPDQGHPYGHRKIEALGAILISFLLFWACYEIATSAWERYQQPGVIPEVTFWSFLIMVGTMAVNYFVSRYEHRKGHELSSQILSADAAHTRSDVYASISVIVSLIAVKLHWPWVDLPAAIVIVFFIGHSGFRIVLEALNTLMDSAQLDNRQVSEIVMGVDGIRKCHNIRTRGNQSAVYMDLNIHVDPDLPTKDAHKLTHQVIASIKKAIPQVVDVVVHTEPNTPKHE